MASKPESVFIRSVHKNFGPVRPYFEKNWNAYRAGTPDVLYSGDEGVMWVEYKYLPKLPTRVPLELDLTSLQARWLANRSSEGRHVAVILGLPEGGIVFDNLTWRPTSPFLLAKLRLSILSRAALARWITSVVGRASS